MNILREPLLKYVAKLDQHHKVVRILIVVEAGEGRIRARQPGSVEASASASRPGQLLSGQDGVSLILMHFLDQLTALGETAKLLKQEMSKASNR